MQALAANQGVCVVFCPAGPVMEYMPNKVLQVPTTPEELLAWAKVNPNSSSMPARPIPAPAASF
jgi:putative spermidine/putrescine transport system substrate-binding protein